MKELTIEEKEMVRDIIMEHVEFWQDARLETMNEIKHGKYLDIKYNDYLDQTKRLRMLESIYEKILEIE